MGARKYKLPRGYLSHTQRKMYKRSPSAYVRHYIQGVPTPDNEYMELGRHIAAELAKDDISADNAIEQIRLLTPAYKQRERELCTGGPIPYKAIFDGCNLPPHMMRLGEYKTGTRPWTQRMVDTDEQVTFYNLVLYKHYGRLPKLCMLHWAETARDAAGCLYLTGNVKTFLTKRTVADVLAMEADCIKVAAGITALMAQYAA